MTSFQLVRWLINDATTVRYAFPDSLYTEKIISHSTVYKLLREINETEAFYPKYKFSETLQIQSLVYQVTKL